MAEWQPIETAPLDRPILARIPGEKSGFVIQWYNNLWDSSGNDCGGWMIVEDLKPPHDWTDGICWEVNEDLEPSTPPDEWKELPNE